MKACLVEHSYYESINPHYDTLLFHSFTTRCQSSNGNITVTVFKSHIQYLLFFELLLEMNVNKPYKPCRALTPCHCTAGFIQASVNTWREPDTHASYFPKTGCKCSGWYKLRVQVHKQIIVAVFEIRRKTISAGQLLIFFKKHR